jgi:hypothetical protein
MKFYFNRLPSIKYLLKYNKTNQSETCIIDKLFIKQDLFKNKYRINPQRILIKFKKNYMTFPTILYYKLYFIFNT